MDKVLREYVGVCGSAGGSHSLFDELADGSEGSSNVGGVFGTFVSIDIVVAAGPMSGGSGGDHPMLLSLAAQVKSVAKRQKRNTYQSYSGNFALEVSIPSQQTNLSKTTLRCHKGLITLTHLCELLHHP